MVELEIQYVESTVIRLWSSMQIDKCMCENCTWAKLARCHYNFLTQQDMQLFMELRTGQRHKNLMQWEWDI